MKQIEALSISDRDDTARKQVQKETQLKEENAISGNSKANYDSFEAYEISTTNLKTKIQLP